jgi:hypothetical protein
LGIDAMKGELLWSIPHESGHVVHVNTPLYYEGKIYMVSEALKDKGGFIIRENYIYSSTYMEDDWHCMNALTGETEYKPFI